MIFMHTSSCRVSGVVHGTFYTFIALLLSRSPPGLLFLNAILFNFHIFFWNVSPIASCFLDPMSSSLLAFIIFGFDNSGFCLIFFAEGVCRGSMGELVSWHLQSWRLFCPVFLQQTVPFKAQYFPLSFDNHAFLFPCKQDANETLMVMSKVLPGAHASFWCGVQLVCLLWKLPEPRLIPGMLGLRQVVHSLGTASLVYFLISATLAQPYPRKCLFLLSYVSSVLSPLSHFFLTAHMVFCLDSLSITWLSAILGPFLCCSTF